MSVSMLLIRPRVGDVLATRCTFFSLRLALRRKTFSCAPLRWPTRYETFGLESGHDEQAAAYSHNILQRGDHQVRNFEGLH